MQEMEVAALEKYSGPPMNLVYITDFPRQGFFRWVPQDKSTPSDGGLVFKDAQGRRYFRIYEHVTPQMFGALGDGQTDDTQAFRAMFSALNRRIRTKANTTPRGNVYLFIPPGAYVLNSSDFLGIGLENQRIIRKGFTIKGGGNGATEIIFRGKPKENFIQNSLIMWLRISDILFTNDTPGANFFSSNSSFAAQNYLFENVGFANWNKGFILTGKDNNSEFTFNSCDMSGFKDSFLFIGENETSDQFVNYRFNDCQWWSTDAPFIDAYRGGHFYIKNLDVSDWGRTMNQKTYLINLKGESHAHGVCVTSVNGLRVEMKSKNCGLLYSEWPQGTVTFENVDISSQTFQVNYERMIHLHLVNSICPAYTFRNFQLAGDVRITGGSEVWKQPLNNILFENGKWLQKDRPDQVIKYEIPVNKGGVPICKFRNVRPYGPSYSTFVYHIWDCDLGASRKSVGEGIEEKLILVKPDPNGVTMPGFIKKLVFPIGVIIQDFYVLNQTGGGNAKACSFTLRLDNKQKTPLAYVRIPTMSKSKKSIPIHENLPHFTTSLENCTLEILADRDFTEPTDQLVFVISYL